MSINNFNYFKQTDWWHQRYP